MPWEKVDVINDDVAGKIICSKCKKEIPAGYSLFYTPDGTRCVQCGDTGPEDKHDGEEALKRLNDPNEVPIPYDKARRDIGLD